MANRTVSPSTQGVRPRMALMYRGKGATRPIPLIVDQSEIRAIRAAAADSKPLGSAVNFPTAGPRPAGTAVIFGTQIGGPGNAINAYTGIFAPLTGTQNFE